jgi:hypothetical protein
MAFYPSFPISTQQDYLNKNPTSLPLCPHLQEFAFFPETIGMNDRIADSHIGNQK